MYNISDIQKGIQCLHSTVEYQLMYGNDLDYINWSTDWKTVIILNGGTSNQGEYNINELGSMELNKQFLIDNNIKHACFYEPDLNNALSSICFIVDERMFNNKKYLSFNDFIIGCNYQPNQINFEQEYMKYLNFKNIEELKFKSWLQQFKLA
jgi:hypothetical protein